MNRRILLKKSSIYETLATHFLNMQQRAFDQLYAEYHTMVFNLVLHYVQNVEDAEEVSQDVFVKVFDGLEDFEHRSTVKTWIYRIAIHQSLDFLKARQSLKRRFLLSIFSLEVSGFKPDPVNFDHPGVRLEQKEAYARLFEAIHRLPDKQKTVIILLKIEDKSQKETAEIMQMTVKAIESLYQRAKNNLEGLLKSEG